MDTTSIQQFFSQSRRGVVRGLHFQYPPKAESKLVRCTRGAILDIIVDLRPESRTFLDHVAIELDTERDAITAERVAPLDVSCPRKFSPVARRTVVIEDDFFVEGPKVHQTNTSRTFSNPATSADTSSLVL